MQLSEWADSDQFEEYEKERKAKDKIITKLQTQVKDLIDKGSNLLVKVDEQKQYFRRNCLLIDEVKENWNKDTDTFLISIINEHFEVDI